MHDQENMGGQNQGQIKNPSVGVPKVKGPELNDRDLLNDVLATQKYLTDNFNVFAREASHDQLHQVTMGILNETHQTAREAYNLMFKKGWYTLTSASRQAVDQAHQQFSNYQTQFPQGARQLQ